MRTLLIRPDKAGDALKTIPALRALRRALPREEIHVLASEHNASLFQFEPGISLHRLPPQWESDGDRLRQALSLFTTPFDRALTLPCDRFESHEQLLDRVPAKSKIRGHECLGRSPAGRDETENIRELLERGLGVSVPPWDGSPAPTLSAVDGDEARLSLGDSQTPWLAVCPFAGGKDRAHADARWEKLVGSLHRTPWKRYVLFGTRADQPTLARWCEGYGEKERYQIVAPSSFRALGAFLSRAQAVLAVDSGPLHYARALGVPSLGILSGGDVARWFPHSGPQDRLLRRGWFGRFPTPWEMGWALCRWAKQWKPQR